MPGGIKHKGTHVQRLPWLVEGFVRRDHDLRGIVQLNIIAGFSDVTAMSRHYLQLAFISSELRRNIKADQRIAVGVSDRRTS